MKLLKLNIQKFASGTISLGTSGNMQGRIVWSSSSNGTSANTSTVTATIQVARTNSYTTTGTFTGNVYIGGNTGGYNKAFSTYTSVSSSWVTLYTHTYTVPHNDNGTGTAYVGGTINGPSGTSLSGNSVSGGQNVTLDTIQRQATITSAPDFNDEDNPTINYSNPAGNSVTSLEACISLTGARDDIAYRSINKTGSSYTFNLTEQERNILRNATPNSNSLGIKFYVKTVINGSTFYSSVNKTMTIVNGNPQFNDYNFEDNNATTVALTGNNQNIIRNYSNVKVTVPVNKKAEAIKSATMIKYRFNCNDKSTDINYNDEGAVEGIINSVGGGVFNLYAIDSRNNSTLVTKNANSVIEYSPLTKGNISVSRTNGVSETVNLELTGKVDLTNFGNTTNSIKQSKYRYKATDAQQWSSYNNLQLTVAQDGNFTFNGAIAGDTQTLGFDINNSYQIEVLIIDELSQITYTATFGSGVPNIALSKNGVGIMGKYDNQVGGYGQVNGNPLAYYPIGSIYMSVNSTSPEVLFGGTWEQITDDAYLKIVSSNAGDLDGTSSNHKIPLSSMPSHSHVERTRTTDGNWNPIAINNSGGSTGGAYPNSAGWTNNATDYGDTYSSGGGQAYYPYYYGVYVWTRTA